MAEDDSQDRTPHFRSDSPTRSRGLLRRLIDGLRGAGPEASAGDPERLGRYRILHRLGQGGMGIVFAAEDETLGRRVAVKTITEPDDSARRRFRREARAAAGVNHPNVCQVYEIDEDQGQLFIAMELLEGEALSERLKRGSMSMAEALPLAQGMLAALQALHEKGTLHRDLKPSNTFLTPHGVKLLDFGLARPLPSQLTQTLERGSELTRPGLLIGTPRYMAPEQVLGHETDMRTDLFSTGAILYEALAGRPAFLGANAVEILSATLHEEPPPLAGNAAVAALDRLIRRALAKRPGERPASAAAMLQELGAISLDEGSGAGRAVARPLARLAVLPFRLLRPDPEIEFLSFALADAVSASLAGLPSVVLRSSASVARFASETPDLKALASQADVDHALTGTLLRAGDQLRVTTQLVEAPAGTLVASQTLQSSIGDVFRLQDELSQRIVAELSPSLALREGAPRRGAPASARAYEFYLRANEVGRDWAHAPVARDLYRQCVDEDPEFAPAWAKLGRCHRLIAKYYVEDAPANLARAEACFRRALELDPELPVAHKLYAHHQSEMGRSRDAMTGLLGLARKNPNDPEIFAGLVHACRYCGLLDASEAAHRETRRLDPHLWTSVVYTWWARGDAERIVGEGTDAGDFELRANALIELGRREEAAALLGQLANRPMPRVFATICHGLLDLLAGKPGASAQLAEIVSVHRDPEAFFLFSTMLAYFGDSEHAMGALVRGVEGGFSVPLALRDHPWLASLRGAPRFPALVERAERDRGLALAAFREAGGEALLGAAS
jgi:serine/threonine protein kinase/tetratricopeptide (TPR) repeat protein